MLFAAALRVYGLAHESPWWDEIVTLDILDAPGLLEFLRLERASDPPMTPVYFTLAWYWSRVAGSSVLSMRLLSVLLGLGCVPVLFLAARRLFDRKAALVASLGLAASLVHVYYSQEIRVYALVTLLALLSMYTLLRAFAADRPASRWLAVHIVLNMLIAFTHLFGLLLFAAQALYIVLFHRRSIAYLAAWGLGHACVLAALAFWISTIDTATIHQAASWMVEPGWRELAMVPAVFAGGRPSNENPAGHLPGGFSLDLVLAAVMGGLIAWFLLQTVRVNVRRKGEAGQPDCQAIVLLLLWFLTPVLGLLAASFVWRPCFVYRYILYSSLPLYILLGAALSRAKRGRVLAVVLAAVWGYQLLAIVSGPFRPDWQAAARFLESRARPTDTIVVLQSINDTALRYNSTLPDTSIRCVEVWSAVCPAVEAAHAAGGNAWVVIWLWSDPANIEACFPEKGFQAETTDFSGWPGLRVYRVAASG